jgi:uncharacterized protein (TIGR03437 family)
MTLPGAARRTPQSESPLPGRSNYLFDPPITGVPHFAALRYASVYPGIDLLFHGAPGGLEYDFRVAPGTDPRAIRIRFDGASRIEAGDLIVSAGDLELRHRAPVAYQEIDGTRRSVTAAYRLRDGIVSFTLGAYDRSRPLVIDPVLIYATYFGSDDSASAILLDSAGNTVIAATGVVYDPLANIPSAFVAKLDPNSNVIFTTYLPPGATTIAGAALDSVGNIIVTGYGSPSATAGAYQTSGAPGFVAKLNSSGSQILFTSTFNAYPSAIAVDASGSIYVTGNVFGNLPATPGVVQPASGGGECSDTPTGAGVCSDAFVLKLSADATKLLYATYLGGNLEDTGLAIAVDTAGDAYITGYTVSPNFPLVNAAQSKFQVFGDYAVGHAFVAKLAPDASKLIYSTYLGGSSADVGNGIAIDSSGNAYIAGSTSSSDFPVTPGAYQTKYAGPAFDPTNPTSEGDAFVVKYSSQGAVQWSTLLGGSELDSAVAIAIDSLGNLYVAGNTGSTDFPTTPDSIPSCRRSTGPFVAEFDPTGARLLRSTYISGIGYDLAAALALDTNSGIVYLAGAASSEVFFAVGTASQKTYGGGDSDAFVAKLNWNSPPTVYVACVLNAASFSPGNQTAFPLGTVAPGEIVSIFGVGLGPAQPVTSPVITSTGSVATKAGGTQVFFDGVPAPLLYVGPNQINAVVPYEVNNATQMTVQSAAGSFGPVAMPVAAAVPAVFTYNGSGIGQAAALNQDGSYNTVANPDTRGQIVTFFVTGAGLMNPPVADGAVSGTSLPLPIPQLPVSVTIRGANAQIQYAGAAPGYVAGLLQINVYVPTSINFGSDVPLFVNFGAFSTQFQVSLAVQ